MRSTTAFSLRPPVNQAKRVPECGSWAGRRELSEFALEAVPPVCGVRLSADLQAQALYIMWSHVRASRDCPMMPQ